MVAFRPALIWCFWFLLGKPTGPVVQSPPTKHSLVGNWFNREEACKELFRKFLTDWNGTLPGFLFRLKLRPLQLAKTYYLQPTSRVYKSKNDKKINSGLSSQWDLSLSWINASLERNWFKGARKLWNLQRKITQWNSVGFKAKMSLRFLSYERLPDWKLQWASRELAAKATCIHCS